MFFEAGMKDASSFADVKFGAFGAMNYVHDVVVWQLNCSVMFILDLGPLTGQERDEISPD